MTFTFYQTLHVEKQTIEHVVTFPQLILRLKQTTGSSNPKMVQLFMNILHKALMLLWQNIIHICQSVHTQRRKCPPIWITWSYAQPIHVLWVSTQLGLCLLTNMQWHFHFHVYPIMSPRVWRKSNIRSSLLESKLLAKVNKVFGSNKEIVSIVHKYGSII
jgi:hypothetical protein